MTMIEAREHPSPDEMRTTMDEAWERTRTTPGHLASEEARFLALAAAAAPAAGVVLEIGSLKGRSTIALAYASAKHGREPVVAVDPHTSPAATDASLEGQTSSYEDFLTNLERAGVRQAVEVHRCFSHELATDWDRPIRLLWIDGDHTFAGTAEDVRLFLPFLAPGGIVAFHDVMHGYEGPDRIFAEQILGSDEFGPVGICRSVGWAQYRPNEAGADRWSSARARLARRLTPLGRLMREGRTLNGLARMEYKLRRALVPHGAVDPAAWLRDVAPAAERR
jgi:MMP 1-O-methyltransferase